jgi:hypothetical protein
MMAVFMLPFLFFYGLHRIAFILAAAFGAPGVELFDISAARSDADEEWAAIMNVPTDPPFVEAWTATLTHGSPSAVGASAHDRSSFSFSCRISSFRITLARFRRHA